MKKIIKNLKLSFIFIFSLFLFFNVNTITAQTVNAVNVTKNIESIKITDKEKKKDPLLTIQYLGLATFCTGAVMTYFNGKHYDEYGYDHETLKYGKSLIGIGIATTVVTYTMRINKARKEELKKYNL